MKAPYAIAVLVALGLAGCKTEVSTTPSGTSSTTVVKEKPAEPSTSTTTINTTPSTPSTTETTKSTTVETPAGSGTATSTTTTTQK